MKEKAAELAKALESAAKALRTSEEGMVAYEVALRALNAVTEFCDWYENDD